VIVIGPDGPEPFPVASKSVVASSILDRVEKLLTARPATAQ
jgi:hypothetical protein